MNYYGFINLPFPVRISSLICAVYGQQGLRRFKPRNLKCGFQGRIGFAFLYLAQFRDSSVSSAACRISQIILFINLYLHFHSFFDLRVPFRIYLQGLYFKGRVFQGHVLLFRVTRWQFTSNDNHSNT